MRKYLGLFATAVMLTAAVACQKEFSLPEDPSQDQTPIFVLEATVDMDGTRAFLDKSGDIFWQDGDALKVFQGTTGYQFTTTEEGKSCRFEYAGDLDEADGDFYALYPFRDDAAIAAGVITTVLPTEQTAVAGSFGKDANLAVAFAPFGETLSFRNAAAYVKVGFQTTDANAQIKKITLRSLDENSLLSGSVTLTPTVTDGAVTDVALTVTDGVPYVSVTAEGASVLSPDTDYYLVAAPAALAGGFRVEFTTADGVTFIKDYSANVALKRNFIAPVGQRNLDKFQTDFEAYWRVTDAADFTEGSYLIGYGMDDSTIRFFDDSKTDCYISSGTPLVEKFSDGSLSTLSSQFSTWSRGGSSPTIMRHYVLWAFRNAFVDMPLGQSVSGFQAVNEDLVLNPSDSYTLSLDANNTLTMKLGYKSSGQQYKNVQLNNCSLSPNGNAAKIIGRITEDSITNLVDIFYIGKGTSFTIFVPKNTTLSAAKNACNVDTTVGFCTEEQTTLGSGETMNNMFMIQNKHLCNTPTPEYIWVYKKMTKAVTYAAFKEYSL